MRRLGLSFSFILVIVSCGDSQTDGRFSPAGENPCNVSCAFDHSKSVDCLNQEVVGEYVYRRIQRQLSSVEPILKLNPADACFCGLATLGPNGNYIEVEIIHSSGQNMGAAIRKALLQTTFAPIPPGAGCLFESPTNPLPISFNNEFR